MHQVQHVTKGVATDTQLTEVNNQLTLLVYLSTHKVWNHVGMIQIITHIYLTTDSGNIP